MRSNNNAGYQTEEQPVTRREVGEEEESERERERRKQAREEKNRERDEKDRRRIQVVSNEIIGYRVS